MQCLEINLTQTSFQQVKKLASNERREKLSLSEKKKIQKESVYAAIRLTLKQNKKMKKFITKKKNFMKEEKNVSTGL